MTKRSGSEMLRKKRLRPEDWDRRAWMEVQGGLAGVALNLGGRADRLSFSSEGLDQVVDQYRVGLIFKEAFLR